MDIGKRPRDDATADIVAEALEAESKAKIVKNEENKVKRSGDKREKKGKTLEEIEAEDGGPVREAMVGMAHTKRAIMRKEKSEGAAEDTNLVTDTADFEKELEVEEEDGITMEPFNLTNERQYGHFDDGGNYVKVKNDEEEELARDAWLALNQEAAMVAPEVLKRMQREHENITKMDEELEQLSGPEIARLKKQVADLMSDGETVVRALARLGGGGHRRPAVRTSKKNPPRTKPSAMDGTLGQQTAAQGAPETGAAGSTPAGLNTLLELVHRLIEAGEAEIYAEKKEDLLQAAALYAPAQAAEADFDMFGDEEQPPVPPPRQAASATAEPASRASAQENAESAAARSVSAEPAVDYNSWPVRELRRFLEERGIDTASIVEKAELVAHVRQEAEKGPEGEGGLAAPEGYVYDHSSGYYYSPTSQLYFDAGSGSFYDSRTSQWLTSDPTVHT